MLQIKKVVIMQSYLVAFLFCNQFRLQYSYIEFCDSMVFGIDPRSRLKSELTLGEMRLVLGTSRSAIISLADEAT